VIIAALEEQSAALKVGMLVVGYDAASTLRLLLNRPAARSVRMSIPSLAHWYPRARVAIRRQHRYACGPLDRGHSRFVAQRKLGEIGRDSRGRRDTLCTLSRFSTATPDRRCAGGSARRLRSID
jgi:hypothetical protein